MTILPTSENWSRQGSNNKQERNSIMNTSKTKAIDPICGMTVDTTTALHAERDGKTFYFCSDH